jgi:subtilisin family serine protease
MGPKDSRPRHEEHRHEEGELPEGVGVAFDGEAGEYLYRKGWLLVDEDDADDAERALRDDGVKTARRQDDSTNRLGLSLLQVDDEEPVAPLVTRLRGTGHGRQLRVSPQYMVSLDSHVMWAPGWDPPRPAEPRPDTRAVQRAEGEGVTVGVVDTGAVSHPWFAGRVDTHDDDIANTDADGALDAEAGHGTFVAGIVLQHAPGARVVARRAESRGGLTDELAVADAILAMPDVDILNLSLGSYGHDDQPPLALVAALRLLWERNPDVVVVASAGNDGWDRPFWPAAAKRVIAVGALDDFDERGERTEFTNFGWWVDACANGLDAHSTFLEWDGPVARHGRGPFTGWARWSGTSFAAPRVAGQIAAEASETKDVAEAAFRLVGMRGLPRKPGLGAVANRSPVA